MKDSHEGGSLSHGLEKSRAQQKPRKESMSHNLETPSSLISQKYREIAEYETEKTGQNHNTENLSQILS